MAKKSANYNKGDVQNLSNEMPVVYRIQTEGGKDNYVGSAQRGRASERIGEHIGKVPGARVKIEQHNSIDAAKRQRLGSSSASSQNTTRRGNRIALEDHA